VTEKNSDFSGKILAVWLEPIKSEPQFYEQSSRSKWNRPHRWVAAWIPNAMLLLFVLFWSKQGLYLQWSLIFSLTLL